MRNWRWNVAIGGFTLVVTSTIGPVSATDATTGQGGYCAVQAYPMESTEPPAEPACFDTEQDVAAYLDGVGAGSTDARGGAANTIIGTVYKDANQGGESLTFWGSSSCAGVTFGFSSLPSGWDNSISSAQASNGCWVTLYTATSYGGSRLNCTPYCASIGSWNDNVKSLVFRPAGMFG